MTTAMSGLMQTDGGNIYFEQAGQGETMLFAHAGFVDNRMWDDQWEYFGRKYQVIRYDMLGFGASEPAKGPVNRRNELLQVFQKLDVNRAILVGCSISGETILDFALKHPGRVSALVLVSTVPSGFEMQGEPPPNMMEMIAAIYKGDLDLASELQLRIWVDGYQRTGQVDAEVRARAAQMNRIPLVNSTWAIADQSAPEPEVLPAVNRLGEIQAPTLVIAGALDHPEILRGTDFIVDQVNGAQKLVLAGCAHLPNMEKPHEFNQRVTEFLEASGLG